MQRLLLFAAFACLLFASCSKDTITTPDTPTPASVNGFFSVSYDTTRFKIDSMRTYFLNEVGILDSAVLKDSVFLRSRTTYTWSSPTRRYRSTDSAFAKVFAWGKFKGTGTVLNIPPLTFSEKIITETDSMAQNFGTLNGKNGFLSSHGFRLR